MKRFLLRISWPVTALALACLLLWLPVRLTASSPLLIQPLQVQGDESLFD